MEATQNTIAYTRGNIAKAQDILEVSQLKLEETTKSQ